MEIKKARPWNTAQRRQARGKGSTGCSISSTSLSPSLSLFAISLHSLSTSSPPPPLLTAPRSHVTARLCCKKQKTLHGCLSATQRLTQGSSTFPLLGGQDEQRQGERAGLREEKEMLAGWGRGELTCWTRMGFLSGFEALFNLIKEVYRGIEGLAGCGMAKG